MTSLKTIQRLKFPNLEMISDFALLKSKVQKKESSGEIIDSSGTSPVDVMETITKTNI